MLGNITKAIWITISITQEIMMLDGNKEYVCISLIIYQCMHILFYLIYSMLLFISSVISIFIVLFILYAHMLLEYYLVGLYMSIVAMISIINILSLCMFTTYS